MTRYGKHLRLLRAKKKVSQLALAVAAGTDRHYVSQIENGWAPPPSNRLTKRFAEALGVDPKRLMAYAVVDKSDRQIRSRISRAVDRAKF